VKNDGTYFSNYPVEFLRVDNTWRISSQRNTSPNGGKMLIKIHGKFIKMENEKISICMYVSESEYLEHPILLPFDWSLNEVFSC
jgi:hypothetical protein